MIADTQKFSYIDSIRGYAVFMVLAMHVFLYGGSEGDASNYLADAWMQSRMGVMLFYMISALTLFLSYNSKIKKEKHHLKNYFIRRAFRILPLFYIVCIYQLVFYKYELLEIIGTLTLTNGYMPEHIQGIVGGGWSIAIETSFYLLIPFLFKYIRSLRDSVIFVVAAVVFSIISRYLVFAILGNTYPHDILLDWVYYWLPNQLPVFGLGIFLYFLFFQSDIADLQNSKFAKQFSYLLLMISIYFFVVSCFSKRLFVFENFGRSIPLMLFIISLAIYQKNKFNNRIMQFYGKISYSFYLLHLIVISWIPESFLRFINDSLGVDFGFFACYVIILIPATIIAYISYLYIEMPFQRLGGLIIKKSES